MSRRPIPRSSTAVLVLVLALLPALLAAREVDLSAEGPTARARLAPIPLAEDAAAPDALVAGGAQSGGTVVFTLDTGERVLYAVTTAGTKSQIAGARRVGWDGVPEQCDPLGKDLSVAEMRRRAGGESTESGPCHLVVGSTQSGKSVAWVLEAGRGQLLAYEVGPAGVRLAGGRRVVHDLAPEELIPQGKRLSVAAVRKLVSEDEGARAVDAGLAGGATTSGAALAFILDREHGRLSAYTVDGTGVRFLGCRALGWDFLAREIDVAAGSISVAEMKRKTGKTAPASLAAARMDVASSLQGGSVCAVVEPKLGRVALYAVGKAGVLLCAVRSFERVPASEDAKKASEIRTAPKS